MNSITKRGGIIVSVLLFLFIASAAQAATYYVDSVSGNDTYNGTSTSTPWRTLTKVNSTTLAAGDLLLFKRGCSWTGQCWPKGSGTSASIIKIGSYGSVASSKPLINGPGGATRAAFFLYNQEYVEVNDLAITHYDGSDTTVYRLGVMVQFEQSNLVADHVYLRNLEVYNVNGNVATKNSGGIFIACSGDAQSGTKSYINDLLIEDCYVHDINRTGISFWSDWQNRTLTDNSTWAPWTNVIVRNNTIENSYCNGLIVRMCTSPVIEYNVLIGCSSGDTGNAMFTFDCDNAVCQYNEGYGTVYNSGDLDDAAFDSDYQCKNTIYQYNYSHDNQLGAFVAVADGTAGKFNVNTIFRYNICQNNLQQTYRSSGDTTTNTKIYNNVFYLGTGLSNNLIVYCKSWNGYPDGVYFYNNIIYNLSSNASYNFGSATNVSFDYNVFYGNHPASEPSDSHKLTSDPLFVNPGSGGTGIDTVSGYQISSSSPCKDSGMTISSNGGKDYWGNTVPYNTTTDRGAHEYQGTTDTTPPTPNPMTWATAPYSAGTSSISMVATTASDASGVEYLFDCTTAGGHDSAWQSSTSYTDTGLASNTSYTYQVKARDLSANHNETTFSTTASATTDYASPDTTPPTPDPMTWATVPAAASSTAITMTATTASDASGVQYYFDCTTAGGHDSAWQSSTSYTDTGLTANTLYTYQVKARDLSVNYNETAFSTTASATTNASGGTPVTIFANGFEDCFTSWTAATAYCSVNYYEGSYSSKHDSTDYVEKAISTSGYTNITVQYARNTSAFDSGADSFVSEWYDGSSWTAIENMTTGFGGWTLTSEMALPSGAANNANFRLRIRVNSAAAEYAYVDAVIIKGVAGVDTTAPTPNPMTWEVAPYSTGASSIEMTATTASDASGVEYFFDCTAGGGHDSAWQDSSTYTDTGLSAGTQYTYQVKARDKSANLNETAFSTTASATTDSSDTTAPTPNPMTWASAPAATGTTSIAMTATTASDVSGVSYFFDCTAGGGHDSSWQDSASYTDTGLTANTQYTYQVKARDKSANLNETAFSTTASATTQASSPTNLLTTDFEEDEPFALWTDGGTSDWDYTNNESVSTTHSVRATSSDNDLISDNLNTSGYSSITIEFYYRDDDIDDDDDAYLQLYDGSAYDNKFELGNSTEDTWHLYQTTLNNSGGDTQYFISNFRIKFEGTSLDSGENLWIDDVTISAQ